MCAGDSLYVDQRRKNCVQDDWQQQHQQLQSVANILADYSKPLVARKSKSASRQNCQLSERIVSAAEQLLVLASAQTSSFAESRGLANCRSNSRDSGLGKDSDSGSSTSSIPMAGQSSNFLPSTQAPSRNCQYVKDFQSPQHPSSQLSSQPPDHRVCTVLPMTNCGRNSSHVTARKSDAASTYPYFQSAQHAAYQYLNECEVLGGKHPRMALRLNGHPPFADFSCRDGKGCSGQRFPIAHNVPCYRNTVNPLHYDGCRHMEMASAQQLSRCRGDMSGQSVRCTATGMSSSNCGRVADCVPAVVDTVDSAFVAERRQTGGCGRASTFDNGSGRHVHGRLVPAEQNDELLYNKCHNVSLTRRPAADSYHNNMDVVHYHTMQQRYRPYSTVDVRHGNSALPRGGSRNAFYQMSPRSLMQFRQNDDELLFYDSNVSGIR